MLRLAFSTAALRGRGAAGTRSRDGCATLGHGGNGKLLVFSGILSNFSCGFPGRLVQLIRNDSQFNVLLTKLWP